MHIDLKRLKAERHFDPFACPPIDIMETLELNAGVLRDSCLINPDVMKGVDAAFSRVTATATTPRMRQLLAIMG